MNETFVRKYLPKENPIGRHVRLANLEAFSDPVHEAWFEIVGVVGDVTNRGLQVPIEPEVWIPYTITGSGAQVVLVRTSQDPGTMMNAVRQEIWETDPGVALAYPSTLEDRISQRLYAGPRFGFLLMTIFGCTGLILVMVGVYSVLAYSTTRRTQEIGIRMALGAERADVLGMVVMTGLRLVVAGMAIGIAISLVWASDRDPARGRDSLRSADACGDNRLAVHDGSSRVLDTSAEGGTCRSNGRAPLSIADGARAIRVKHTLAAQ